MKLKNKKDNFFSMILGTLGVSLLRNILAGKRINRAGEGAIARRQGERVIRPGYGNKKGQKNNKMDF